MISSATRRDILMKMIVPIDSRSVFTVPERSVRALWTVGTRLPVGAEKT